MGDLYRVIVFRESPDESGDPISETLVELAAPREMLAQFAPQAVAAALGTSVAIEAPEQSRMAMTGPAETPEQKTERRKRRTKAEMEAARASETVVTLDRSLTATPIMQTPAPVYPEPVPMPAEASAPVYDPFGRG